VKYGEDFSRSYSILKAKQEELLNQLAGLKGCFDKSGDLKWEAEIPDLCDLEIILHDKSKVNEKQVKSGTRGKLTKCLG
jgi:hypothetical protein